MTTSLPRQRQQHAPHNPIQTKPHSPRFTPYTPHQASGIVTFENRGGKDAVLKSGQITICNGNFLIPEEGANTTASTTGCSGSTYSLPLSVNASNSKIPANGQTAVPFGGTIVINRIVSALVNNRGISGPVATAYADALLDNGQRVFSSPRTYGIGLAPREQWGLGFRFRVLSPPCTYDP